MPRNEVQKRHAPGQLGDNATKDLILRHAFEIAPEVIKQPSDLLRVLVRRHYSGQRIPIVPDERLIQLLRQTNLIDGWQLLAPARREFVKVSTPSVTAVFRSRNSSSL